MVKEIIAIKHRPKTIDEYIFQNNFYKAKIEEYIRDQSIPNLLFYGRPGTGKTSLAYLLKSYLNIEDCDFLELNASKDNSVDNVRNQIVPFASSMAMGNFKIVFLDECDRLTPAAQDTLRAITENSLYTANVRFIFSCNHVHKIEDAITSRLQQFEFKLLSKEQMTERLAIVLDKEKIKIGNDISILERYINVAYPDFRKVLQLVEQNTIDGRLRENNVSLVHQCAPKILELLGDKDWQSIRKLANSELETDDFLDIYRYIYNNIHNTIKDMKKVKSAIPLIAEHMYKHNFVADPEINFISCIIKLTEI